MNHAYFYRPKVDISNLDNYKHVIFQSYDEQARDALTNVETVMRYAIPQPEGPAELQGIQAFTPEQVTAWKRRATWRNGPTWNYYDFVLRYHPNEQYFLHGPDGKRLVSWQGERAFYLIRPRFAAKQFWTDVVGIMDRDGWKHAFVDNVGLDDTKIREVLKLGIAQEYAGGDQSALYQQEWCEFLDVGREMLGPDRRIFANTIGDWKAQRSITSIVQQLNGVMLEAFSPWLNMRDEWTVDDDLRMLKRVKWLTEQNKEVICVCHVSSADPTERLSYEYARYLMVASDTTSVRLVRDGKYGPIVRCPEMDPVLGKPLEDFVYVPTTGYMHRNFEHYVISIDTKSKKAFFHVHQNDKRIAELQQQVKAVIAREQELRDIVARLEQQVQQQQTAVANIEQRLDKEIVVKF